MRYFSNINSIKQRNQGDDNTEIFSMGLAVFVIILSLVFFTVERVTFNAFEAELSRERKVNQGLEEAVGRLRFEKRERELPQNLAKEAAKLGFTAPRKEQVISY